MKEIDDLNADILFIKFLIFCPPFPRDAINELRHFLIHGAGVVEDPFRFLLFREIPEIDSDALVEDFLEPENFFEFIGYCHGGGLANHSLTDNIKGFKFVFTCPVLFVGVRVHSWSKIFFLR